MEQYTHPHEPATSIHLIGLSDIKLRQSNGCSTFIRLELVRRLSCNNVQDVTDASIINGIFTLWLCYLRYLPPRTL